MAAAEHAEATASRESRNTRTEAAAALTDAADIAASWHAAVASAAATRAPSPAEAATAVAESHAAAVLLAVKTARKAAEAAVSAINIGLGAALQRTAFLCLSCVQQVPPTLTLRTLQRCIPKQQADAKAHSVEELLPAVFASKSAPVCALLPQAAQLASLACRATVLGTNKRLACPLPGLSTGVGAGNSLK
jgi:hypothetical protein